MDSTPAHLQSLIANPRVDRSGPYPAELKSILSLAAGDRARSEIESWEGYAPTPLVSLGATARALGVSEVWMKDEGERFGLGSFKALGGAYGLARLLAKELGPGATGQTGSNDPRHTGDSSRITAACATDGNHGRSVAWAARNFGCRCVVYLHERVSRAREAAIAEFGAEIRRTSGTYDDSVAACDRDARREGWFVISDTSYPGYETVPRDVMQGYTVMVAEALEQWPPGKRPTHVFVQGGVGGLAAAVCAHFWELWGPDRPILILVEPETADCLHRSIKAGRPTAAPGDLKTVMAGLSCGEVSLLAWQVLKRGADFAMTLPDAAATEAVRALATGGAGETEGPTSVPHDPGLDPPIGSAESGAAGWAGLMEAATSAEVRQRMNLDEKSQILLFNTEGAAPGPV